MRSPCFIRLNHCLWHIIQIKERMQESFQRREVIQFWGNKGRQRIERGISWQGLTQGSTRLCCGSL